jgi:hypothetical protein
MKKFLRITYYAYADEPFDPDGVGYVEERYLRSGTDGRFMYWGRDGQPRARSGYTYVYGPGIYGGEGCAIVKSRHIYTEVVEESALTGGYGMPYPGGGMTATSEYDLDGETVDEYGESRTVHLARWHF